MSAFNVVRFRVKPEGEEDFLAFHRAANPEFEGMRRFTLFKTADRTYCVIGEWESFDHLAAARPQMLGLLDNFRHHLEDLGAELGVSDAVSGAAIIDRAGPAKRAARKAKKKAAKKPAKKAVKKAAKKPARKAASKPKRRASKPKAARRGRR